MSPLDIALKTKNFPIQKLLEDRKREEGQGEFLGLVGGLGRVGLAHTFGKRFETMLSQLSFG